jgi:hypothetical protein
MWPAGARATQSRHHRRRWLQSYCTVFSQLLFSLNRVIAKTRKVKSRITMVACSLIFSVVWIWRKARPVLPLGPMLIAEDTPPILRGVESHRQTPFWIPRKVDEHSQWPILLSSLSGRLVEKLQCISLAYQARNLYDHVNNHNKYIQPQTGYKSDNRKFVS